MMDTLVNTTNQISRALRQARTRGRGLPGFPGDVPGTLEDAYAVQVTSIAAWPDAVAGWKVGGVPEGFRRQYPATRLAGPIFARNVRMPHLGETTVMTAFPGGFCAVEAEIVFRLGQTIHPGQMPVTESALKACMDSAHVGVEIAGSPLPDINAMGPGAVISDFGNNAGLIVGPEIPLWKVMPAEQISARVIVDGAQVGEATCAQVPGGPLAAVRFLIAHCAEYAITLERGTLISTGAITGVHEVGIGAQVHVTFGVFGAFDVEIVAAPAQE